MSSPRLWLRPRRAPSHELPFVPSMRQLWPIVARTISIPRGPFGLGVVVVSLVVSLVGVVVSLVVVLLVWLFVLLLRLPIQDLDTIWALVVVVVVRRWLPKKKQQSIVDDVVDVHVSFDDCRMDGFCGWD